MFGQCRFDSLDKAGHHRAMIDAELEQIQTLPTHSVASRGGSPQGAAHRAMRSHRASGATPRMPPLGATEWVGNV